MDISNFAKDIKKQDLSYQQQCSISIMCIVYVYVPVEKPS